MPSAGKEKTEVARMRKPEPRRCPEGPTKTQRRCLQKLCRKEIAEKMVEEERDSWFYQAHSMIVPKKTWREKRLAKEDRSNDSEGSDGSSSPGGDGQDMDINMVFELPTEFRAPEVEVAELVLGAKKAMFEKPEKLGQHVKPLYIWGHLEGRPMDRMFVDGGTGVNIMPLSVFEKLGYQEGELMKTNTRLCGFTGEVTEAKGVMSVELTVGSKTMATAFFVVAVKSRYNVLLGRDWIHANACVPSTLHQCVVQWIGNDVEIINTHKLVQVATSDAHDEF